MQINTALAGTWAQSEPLWMATASRPNPSPNEVLPIEACVLRFTARKNAAVIESREEQNSPQPDGAGLLEHLSVLVLGVIEVGSFQKVIEHRIDQFVRSEPGAEERKSRPCQQDILVDLPAIDVLLERMLQGR